MLRFSAVITIALFSVGDASLAQDGQPQTRAARPSVPENRSAAMLPSARTASRREVIAHASVFLRWSDKRRLRATSVSVGLADPAVGYTAAPAM